jgi:hypothetical protein
MVPASVPAATDASISPRFCGLPKISFACTGSNHSHQRQIEEVAYEAEQDDREDEAILITNRMPSDRSGRQYLGEAFPRAIR